LAVIEAREDLLAVSILCRFFILGTSILILPSIRDSS
jgi:hypothetical protein